MAFLTVTYSIDNPDEVQRLAERIAIASDPELQVTGVAVQDHLRKYHRAFIPRWENRAGRTWNRGVRESQQFGRAIVDAWLVPRKVAPGTIAVTNAHPLLPHKVTGGTITAKRAKMLTIPMRGEAHGRRARDLEVDLGVRLFLLKRRGKLFLAGKDGQQLRIYYLLKRSVTQQPWPGAMPPDEGIADVAAEALAEAKSMSLQS